jgi:hypothetical protein
VRSCVLRPGMLFPKDRTTAGYLLKVGDCAPTFGGFEASAGQAFLRKCNYLNGRLNRTRLVI